jgi:hypothetical protein
MDFDIVSEISAESVGPIIAALQDAGPERTLRIILRTNRGGDVGAAFALIIAIQESEAPVEIHMDRHIMSAAAFIWVYFATRKRPGTNSNVIALRPAEPAVLMYHRPRQPCADSPEHYLFRDDLEDEHPLREQMAYGVQVFDTVFDELLQALGYSEETELLTYEGAQYRHNLSHMKAAYYQNRDCFLTF